MSDYIDTINRQEAIDAFNEQNWKLSDILSYPICKEIRKAAQDTIRSLPSEQPVITFEDVKKYCEKRHLVILTMEFYDEMKRTLQSAQPEPCKDAVPRTSVEYICRKNTVSTNPYEHKYHDKFIQFMDDPEISDFGRWQHSNGFNTALVAVKCDLDKVPSAQPEREKGKWILHYDEMMLLDGTSISGVACSKCGWKTYNKIHRLIACPYNFCPNCGADMREGQDDT